MAAAAGPVHLREPARHAIQPGPLATSLQYAFDLQDAVARPNTVWSIVYDVSGRQVYFQTRQNPHQRRIAFNDFDFSRSQPVRFADVESSTSANGKINFSELSEAEHWQYLEHFVTDPAVKQSFGDLMPQIRGQLLMLRGFHPADAAVLRFRNNLGFNT